MNRLNKGLLVGFFCFCVGYIAHDIVGATQLKLFSDANAYPIVTTPRDHAPQGQKFDLIMHRSGIAEDWKDLACNKQFYRAVLNIIEKTVKSGSLPFSMANHGFDGWEGPLSHELGCGFHIH